MPADEFSQVVLQVEPTFDGQTWSGADVEIARCRYAHVSAGYLDLIPDGVQSERLPDGSSTVRDRGHWQAIIAVHTVHRVGLPAPPSNCLARHWGTWGWGRRTLAGRITTHNGPNLRGGERPIVQGHFVHRADIDRAARHVGWPESQIEGCFGLGCKRPRSDERTAEL